MSAALGIVIRAIDAHPTAKAGFTRAQGQTGAVTLVQRFGGALNLNIHFHGYWTVFTFDDPAAAYGLSQCRRRLRLSCAPSLYSWPLRPFRRARSTEADQQTVACAVQRDAGAAFGRTDAGAIEDRM
ncbi:hypothetical protein BH24PSE2_BH24PSE2_01140 [soil metagenome]